MYLNSNYQVKKPNGDNYAADSVLYLTYGIQEYLFENGRIDNIFTDQYYEPFTSALHEVVKDFKVVFVVVIFAFNHRILYFFVIKQKFDHNLGNIFLVSASNERTRILCN